MSYFNMVCDGCGREVQGYNIVNGMKFCAKCYQEIFGNKNMTENLKNMYEAYLKILNEKDQRIAELEEQLKKKPKYNIGDRVYIINEDYEVERDFIESIDIDTDGIEYYTETYSICWYENQLFATKAEAQAKLEELKGEKR